MARRGPDLSNEKHVFDLPNRSCQWGPLYSSYLFCNLNHSILPLAEPQRAVIPCQLPGDSLDPTSGTAVSPSALTDLLHALRASYRLVHVDETQSVLLLYVERLLRATGCDALRLRHQASGVECVVASRPGGERIVALEHAGPGSTARLFDIGAELGATSRWLLGWDRAPPEEPGRGADPERTQQLVVPPPSHATPEPDGSADTPPGGERGPGEATVLRRTLREVVYSEGRAVITWALRRLCNEWEAAPESVCHVELQLRQGAADPHPEPAERALRAWLAAPPAARAGRERPLFLLVGAPGAGKSTLLRHLAVSLAREHLSALGRGEAAPAARAPILVPVPAEAPPESLELDALLDGAVPGMSGRLLRLWVELGLCALLLDGPIALEDAARLWQLPTLLPESPPRAIIAERARYYARRDRDGAAATPALLEEALRGGWDLGHLEPLSDELLQRYLDLGLPDPVLRSAALSQLARSDNLRRICRRPGLLAALTAPGQPGAALGQASAGGRLTDRGEPILGQGVIHGAPAPPLGLLHRALRPDWLEGAAGDRRIERTARELLARVLARRLLRGGGAPVPFWDLVPEIGAEVPGEPDGARLILHLLRALDDTMFVVEHAPLSGPGAEAGPRLRFALPSAADYFTGEDLALRLGTADVSRVGACLQRGGSGQLRAAALSRSGRLCATGADDGTVRVWEAASGFLLRALPGHFDPVTALQFIEDDARLVSASQDFTVRVWEVLSGRTALRLTGHADSVTALGYAPGSELLCSASLDGTVRVWQLPAGRCVQVLRPPGEGVVAVAMSPDGLLCAAATTDSLVHIFHAWSGELLSVLGGHSGAVRSLALSPDGRLCATGSEDATVRLTEVHTGNLVQALRACEQEVSAVAFSPDGRLLAAGSADQTVRVFAMPAPGEHTPAQPLHCLRGHGGTVHSVAFQPAGPPGRVRGRRTTLPPVSRDPGAGAQRLLLSASGDGTALLWDAASGELLRPLDGSAAGAPAEAALQVRCLAVSPDGDLLAAGGADGALRLWDAARGRLLRELRGHEGGILCAAFSPGGEVLATGGADHAVCLWDPQQGELLDRLEGHGGDVTALAFSPDGYLLASGSADGSVRLREAQGGLTLRTLSGPAPVTQALFTPDGRRVAVAGSDGALRLWEVAGGPPVAVLQKHLSRVTALAMSSDGRLLASAGDDQLVRIWDAQSGRAMHAMWGHLDGISALAFSPDGEVLASAGWDRAVRLWEPRGGRALGVLPGWAGWLWALCFTPDGRALVAGGQDGLLLWQVPEGRVLGHMIALGEGWLTLVPVPDGAEDPPGAAPPRYALYAAEPEAPTCLRMSDGLLSYPSSGWSRLCHRPQLVAAALSRRAYPDLHALQAELLSAPVPMPVLESSGSRATPAAEPLTVMVDTRSLELDAYAQRLTAEELLRAGGPARGELDRGAVVPLGPVTYAPGRVSGRLHALLAMHVVPRELGDLPSADTGYLLQRDPDVLRAPDVSFVSRARIAQAGTAGFFTGAPDLAAEVVSQANPWELVEQKALEYLQNGARLVWILDPQTRTVHVHESPVQVRILGEEDRLGGGAVLPGFSAPVRDLFG